MKKILIAVAIMTGLALSASAAPIEWWDMSDTAGTDLKDISNSGTLGSIWNGRYGATDGNGLLVISGDGGTTTKKLPAKGTVNAELTGTDNVYENPITTGAYSMTVDFDSWNYAAGSAGDLWKLKAQNSAGTDIAGIELGMNPDTTNTTVRIRFWTLLADGSSAYRSTDSDSFDLTDASGALAEVRFDFDNDTVGYYIDGVEKELFDNFGGSEIAGMVFTTSGTWATGDTSFAIDSMGMDVVPEPATVGMLGLGALLTLCVRRLKPRY